MSQSQSQTTPVVPLPAYQPIAGAYDEMIATTGEIRPSWNSIQSGLEGLGQASIQSVWDQAQREIVRNGVTYNPHDDSQGENRPWVLDVIPMVLSEAEANTIAVGMQQRAQLFNHIVEDLLGEQRLLRDKLIPAEALFGHPKYSPVYQNLHKPTDVQLHLYAADLARAPDGSWWATSNRSRAPFGLGYVVENRLIMSRLMTALFRASHVHRVAPFFASLRETMRDISPRNHENPRVVLWTKGPKGGSFFEDAYLARYLGYTLAEGEDIAVRDNRVVLKTLGGLLPVDVLLRRVEDDECDSLELLPTSQVGISGLLEVVRAGHVSVANGIGSSLVESPIFSAFMPVLCREILGEELKIPSVATWWCGNPTALAYVLEHLDELILRPAFGNADSIAVRTNDFAKPDRDAFIEQIKQRPEKWVGHEMVHRSTTPVWTENGLSPRYLGLRSYAVRSGDTYTALKGGAAWVSANSETLDLDMTSGEYCKDVWVIAEGKIDETTLLPHAGRQVPLCRSGADLPSHAAEDLYWLGRNLERAEGLTRFLRTAYKVFSGEYQSAHVSKLVRTLLGDYVPTAARAAVNEDELASSEFEGLLCGSVFRSDVGPTLQSMIGQAMRLASNARDRISLDMWHSVSRQSAIVGAFQRPVKSDLAPLLSQFDALISELATFSGLASESMTRMEGWRFLEMGRRIERAIHTSRLLRFGMSTSSDEDTQMLEFLLQVADSIMTYRVRYLSTVQVAPVMDLLMTDESNPRSVAFQLKRLQEHVDALPRKDGVVTLSPEQRIALSMTNAMRLADVYMLSRVDHDGRRVKLDKLLIKTLSHLPKLSEHLSGNYFVHARLTRHLGASGLDR